MILLLLFSFLAPQFRPALSGYHFTFPQDHGSHPDYKTEWWYFTGHLSAADGRRFGYELTFFRVATDRNFENPSRWRVDDLHMAHFALTDPAGNRFQFAEKLNRSGPGIAGTTAGDLNAWNENWYARFAGQEIQLKAAASGIAVLLSLSPGVPVIHGTQGVSQKAAGEGQASHYYSFTRISTIGSMQLAGENLKVSGLSWMDHEFGSNQLAGDQAGWDWFGLELDNGEDLMLYRMRLRDGGIDSHSSGTLVHSGSVVHLDHEGFTAVPGRRWKSDKSGGDYPVEWEIRVPSAGGELHLKPVMDSQELTTLRSTGIAYWEGEVEIVGTWRGKPVRGRGYVELTGYADNSRPKV